MRNRLGAAVLVALFGVLSGGWAGAAEPARKVGFVDLQAALMRTEAGKEAARQLAQKKQTMEKILKEKDQELGKLKGELEKQGMLLSPQVRESRQWEYQLKAREFERLLRNYDDELRREENVQANRIAQELRRIVEDMGREGGYALILDRGAVVYAGGAVDVTEEVIKAHNAARKAPPTKR